MFRRCTLRNVGMMRYIEWCETETTRHADDGTVVGCGCATSHTVGGLDLLVSTLATFFLFFFATAVDVNSVGGRLRKQADCGHH